MRAPEVEVELLELEHLFGLILQMAELVKARLSSGRNESCRGSNPLLPMFLGLQKRSC
jgi:hypothetical protein